MVCMHVIIMFTCDTMDAMLEIYHISKRYFILPIVDFSQRGQVTLLTNLVPKAFFKMRGGREGHGTGWHPPQFHWSITSHS